MPQLRTARAVLAALVVLLLAAGAYSPSYAATRALPPTGTDWDYQLGGNRSVPAHVGIVERDRTASPVSGKYNVCYVNGFQTQAEQKRFWHRHWSLVLKHSGRPVVDSVWAEWDGTSVGFDFAVAEQCAQYSECASYAHHYGSHVLAVEYHAKAFGQACRTWSDRISVVRRDVNLTRHGVRRRC